MTLYPCPFCGPLPEHERRIGGPTRLRRLTHNCPVIGFVLIEAPTPEQVAARWNTRATPPREEF